MKKLTSSIFTILLLTLTACGSGTTNNQQFSPSQSNKGATAELPLASKLVIGSLKLEGTDNAITAEQAAELIPLWQVYEQLSISDTAAQQEITALAEQIQETMTADQMKAIDEMNLTPQDIITTIQEQGIQSNGRQQNGQGNNTQSPNGGNFPRGGDGGPQFFFQGGPGGGPDGGGPGGFNGGQGLSPQQIATAQARRAQNGENGFNINGTPTPLIEALVKILQEKAGS